MFAPPPSPQQSPRQAPVEPCLTSYRDGASGVDPFTTVEVNVVESSLSVLLAPQLLNIAGIVVTTLLVHAVHPLKTGVALFGSAGWTSHTPQNSGHPAAEDRVSHR